MILVDTSVVVAAFASWHEAHDPAARLLRTHRPRLAAHSAVETYSVLTRLPPPHRFPPAVAERLLREAFPDPWPTLSAAGYRQLLESLGGRSLGGGAVYDALVAATAREAGGRLVSRDRRARATYDLVGIDVEALDA